MFGTKITNKKGFCYLNQHGNFSGGGAIFIFKYWFSSSVVGIPCSDLNLDSRIFSRIPGRGTRGCFGGATGVLSAFLKN